MHPLLGGRCRRNIKLIEAATKAAIYFPPPFPRAYGYTPPGAHRRGEDEVFITGPSTQSIIHAKQRLHELVSTSFGGMPTASNIRQALGTKCYVKDVALSSDKIDCILLDRLDKVRRITESTGSCVIFPQLGTRRGRIRVQATEILHVERTVREVMALVSVFFLLQIRSFILSVLMGSPGRPVLHGLVVDRVARPGLGHGDAATVRRRCPHDAVGHLHQQRRRHQLREVDLPHLRVG